MNASLSAAAPWWRPNTGDKLILRGGRPLVGVYPISGAKNAVLPIMVSALLTPHLVTLRNVPANLDVAVLAALLQRLGCEMHWSESGSGLSVTIAADRVQAYRIDPDLVTRMRASVLLLGALLARCGEASLPMPGGDAIGLRGIDFHLAGLRSMGARIELDGGLIHAKAHSGLSGADILLPQPPPRTSCWRPCPPPARRPSATPHASPRSPTWRLASSPWAPRSPVLARTC